MDHRTDKQRQGDAVEQYCVDYLQQRGLQLLAKNARFREGEIDLVLLDQQTLVFCEVRYRRSEKFGGALGSIDQPKCLRIAAAAEHWRAQHPRYHHLDCRFDAIAVSGEAKRLHVDWRQHAFRLEDLR
jgi:putative endonuclease